MWYALDAKPGARVHVGFKPGVRSKDLDAALAAGATGGLLRSFCVRAGDAFYIPGGTVHAIGEGCLLFEVQQSSNTTYRLDDWGRVDDSGKPRELHVDQARRAIDWHDRGPLKRRAAPAGRSGRNSVSTIVESPFFRIERMRVQRRLDVENDGASFHALFTVSGGAEVLGADARFSLPAGSSCLMPAGLARYTLAPLGDNACLIRTRLPTSPHSS
jgi:mannose-6-phosphate isomerase